MAHDFAKKRAPSSSRKHPDPKKSGHWRWFFSGLLTGVFVCVLGFMALSPPKQQPTTAASQQTQDTTDQIEARKETQKEAPKKVAASKQPAPDARGKPEFTFYTLLPESEVLVNDEAPATSKPASDKTATSEPVATTSSDQKTPSATPTVAEPKLILQAGSFQKLGDADRRRGDVILLGYQARIESVEHSGQTWHRVHIGPFRDAATLNKAQRSLKDVGIDTIKVGSSG